MYVKLSNYKPELQYPRCCIKTTKQKFRGAYVEQGCKHRDDKAYGQRI